MTRWPIGEIDKEENIINKFLEINLINTKNRNRDIGKKKTMKTKFIGRE